MGIIPIYWTYPKVWCEGLFSKQIWCPFAVKLLSTPASAAVIERVWSTFGNVQTKTRNWLKNDRSEKIVFLRAKLSLLEPVGIPDESSENEEDFGKDSLSLF